jgi:hypothetical protein
METAENSGQQSPSTRRRRMTLVLRVVRLLLLGSVLLGNLPLGLVTDGWAQASSPGSTGEFLRGKVTAIGTTTIRIDTTDYLLDPAVSIKDGVGHPRMLKDITLGAPVRFHFKDKRIDVIILINSPG